MTATILLVEDHADIRRLVRMTLEFEDCHIVEAADAEQAWSLMQAQRPDLILLDVMMPGRRDGLALCRDLRADARFADVPVVMLSARGNPEDVEAGRRAGADAYLVKPFSPMNLLDRVGDLLAQAADRC